MANEKSCGAIIYKIENYVRKYLIIRGTGNYRGDCGFPKGHMEEGEFVEHGDGGLRGGGLTVG